MKGLLFFVLLITFWSTGQTLVKVQISYQTSYEYQNTVHIDSNLVESGFGQGGTLKFHLLIFNNDCELIDTLALGEYNPYGSNFKAYHYRQNNATDLAQLDSTLKYRIPVGYHYFLFTPCQYRKDFVSAAYPPMLSTLDSLWSSQVSNTSTAFIAYSVKGFESYDDYIIVNPANTLTSLTKNICFDLGYTTIENDEKMIPLVYPNPTKSEVNILLQEGLIHTIEFCDYSGKILYSSETEISNCKLDVSFLNSGQYLVKIVNQNDVFYQKLIIE